jgi:potassium transporter
MTAVEQREGELASAETTPAETSPYHGALATMAIGALGVVYGDIGTSPLYTFKTAIEWAGGEVNADGGTRRPVARGVDAHHHHLAEICRHRHARRQ